MVFITLIRALQIMVDGYIKSNKVLPSYLVKNGDVQTFISKHNEKNNRYSGMYV